MKKICVLDGRVTINEKINEEINNLLKAKKEYELSDWFILKGMNINYCIGCWDCWLKTPGICRLKDEHEIVLRSVINSDELLFISDESVGFITATLKKTMDRLIPSVLPYIKIIDNESHHYQRYKNTPNIHVILVKKASTTKEDIDLVRDYFTRVSLNFDSKVKSFFTIEKEGDLNHELFNI